MSRTVFSRAFAALVVVAAIVALPQRAFADTIFSQPPVNGASTGFSDVGFAQQLADDFSLSSATSIVSLRFWGSYYTPPATPAPAPASSDFTIRFYNDSFGSPDFTPFNQQTVTGVVPVLTGLTNPQGGAVYQFTVNLPTPLALSSGTTYYLGLLESAPAGTIWGWIGDGAGTQFVRSSDASGWGVTGPNLAFELSNSPVAPLPTTAAAGIALLLTLIGTRAWPRLPAR